MTITEIIKKKSLIMAAAAVVGGASVISGVGSVNASAMEATHAPAMSDHAPMAGHVSSAADGLRVTMNNLLREHVTTSLTATRAIERGASQPEMDAAFAAQYANSDALSAAVGSVYGGAAQEHFSYLFAGHIAKSNAYAMALAHGDDSGKQAALQELHTYLYEIADFFSGAIPGLQSQDVYGMLNEHEELINKSTDAYKAGDFVQSFQLEREALKQISMAADALSSGIISTQPTLFK